LGLKGYDIGGDEGYGHQLMDRMQEEGFYLGPGRLSRKPRRVSGVLPSLGPFPRAVRPPTSSSTNPSTTICRSWKRRTSSTSRSERSKSLRRPTPVALEPMSPHPKKSPKGVRASVKSPKIAKKAVDGLSRSLQSRSKLVESPFPPRNQTWKQTFWTGTRKPNSYPLPNIPHLGIQNGLLARLSWDPYPGWLAPRRLSQLCPTASLASARHASRG
jgi:hypothetical protein